MPAYIGSPSSHINQNELYHHGIKGQKWGVRRWQNDDGSLTDAGRRHYGKGLEKGSARYEAKAQKAYEQLSKPVIKKTNASEKAWDSYYKEHGKNYNNPNRKEAIQQKRNIAEQAQKARNKEAKRFVKAMSDLGMNEAELSYRDNLQAYNNYMRKASLLGGSVGMLAASSTKKGKMLERRVNESNEVYKRNMNKNKISKADKDRLRAINRNGYEG